MVGITSPLGVILATTLGALDAGSLFSVALVAAFSATVGFITTFFLKRLFKYLKIRD